MGNLLLLFARLGNLILFIALEILCLYLIINFNQSQRSIFLNSSSVFSGYLNNKVNNASDYFQLGTKNDRLAEENSKLLEQLINIKSDNSFTPGIESDSLGPYELTPASVINNSTHKKNNRLTLNKGRKDSIMVGMGVINENGLVGIINNVSSNYSTAISLLNLQTSISVKHLPTDEIGELKWDGRRADRMIMSSVPPHATINVGDSIITSGYSTIFPPEIFIGTVSKIENDPRSGFLSLEVELNNNLSTLEYVYIIKNENAKEQLELESDE